MLQAQRSRTLITMAMMPKATVVQRRSLAFVLGQLGGAESLVTQPCTTTHHGLTPEERSRRGISDAMLRLSIGIEDADDLIADLRQALD